MIDYDFYVNSYLGSEIPEKIFPRMAARAWDALCHIRQQYQVKNSDTVSEKMALCAMERRFTARKAEKRASVQQLWAVCLCGMKTAQDCRSSF